MIATNDKSNIGKNKIEYMGEKPFDVIDGSYNRLSTLKELPNNSIAYCNCFLGNLYGSLLHETPIVSDIRQTICIFKKNDRYLIYYANGGNSPANYNTMLLTESQITTYCFNNSTNYFHWFKITTA